MYNRTEIAKKYSKNIWLGVLATIVALALLWTPGVARPTMAWADGSAEFAVGNPGEVSPGSEFTVPVTISNNPGFAAAVFSISYDTSALQLVGITKGKVFTGQQLNNVEGNAVAFLGGEDCTENGQLFSATFKVLDGANGSYDIAVGLKDNTDKNLTNYDGSSVPASFTPASVSIAGTGTGTGTGTGGGEANTPVTPGPGTTTPGTDDTTPGTGNATNPSQGHTVTATGPDGENVDILVRTVVDGQEYSLDEGQTWQRVPEDSIIVTPKGQRIQLSEDGQTATIIDSATPLTGSGEEFPLALVLSIIAGLIVVGAAIVFVITRSRRRKQAVKEINSAVGRHARV